MNIKKSISHTTVAIIARYFRLLRLVAVVAIWVTACKHTKEDTSKSLLESSPCQVPCWQGIVPGVTDEVTMAGILRSLEIVNHNSIEKRVSEVDSNYVIYDFRFAGRDGVGSVGIRNGIAYRIGLTPGSESQLTLEELFANIGPPDFVYAEDASNEFYCYSAELVYLTRGVWVRTGVCSPDTRFEQVGNKVKLCPDLEAVQLAFFESDHDLESALLRDKYGAYREAYKLAQYIAGHSSPWGGFEFYPLDSAFTLP